MTDESFTFWMLLEASAAALKSVMAYSGKDLSGLWQEEIIDVLEKATGDMLNAIDIAEEEPMKVKANERFRSLLKKIKDTDD